MPAYILLRFIIISLVYSKAACIQLPVLPHKEIPVLCYHNIDKSPDKVNDLRISEEMFDRQMKALHDSGFQSILPDQLYDHLTKGTSLPSKPVMITFDDTHDTHYSIATPVLNKYCYKGVFFIMTVCINKKNYLSEQQIKTLAKEGHAIACHTYDHPSVTHITAGQWEQQIDKPKRKLEAITQNSVEYFAYPYGTWNETAIIELKKRGIKAAFQLSGKMSLTDPIYTIERLLVSGTWSEIYLLRQIEKKFR